MYRGDFPIMLPKDVKTGERKFRHADCVPGSETWLESTVSKNPDVEAVFRKAKVTTAKNKEVKADYHHRTKALGKVEEMIKAAVTRAKYIFYMDTRLEGVKTNFELQFSKEGCLIQLSTLDDEATTLLLSAIGGNMKPRSAEILRDEFKSTDVLDLTARLKEDSNG